MKAFLFISIVIICLVSCTKQESTNYEDDIQLLQKYTQVIELTSNNGESRIALTPEFQGKVMTSSCTGLSGLSNGWVNRTSLQNDSLPNGASAGGEDRIWISPLGGQFSFFYTEKEPLDEANWLVPACMSEEPYEIVAKDKQSIEMQKKMDLTNFSHTHFNILLKRKIEILDRKEIENNLGTTLPSGLSFVAYESSHVLINSGTEKWKKETGLAGIWNLGMLRGADNCVAIIPFSEKIKNADINQYLGTLDSTRLKISDKTLTYKTDGKYRSKIGIPPEIASDIFGSYTPETNTLHIIQYQKTDDSLYFNSAAVVQENPYSGETIQIYNNGSMDYLPTKENSFYEMETTSALKELAPGDSISHYHRVYHFCGTFENLTKISVELLGTELSATIL